MMMQDTVVYEVWCQQVQYIDHLEIIKVVHDMCFHYKVVCTSFSDGQQKSEQ